MLANINLRKRKMKLVLASWKERTNRIRNGIGIIEGMHLEIPAGTYS